jgi:hypothetical protein
MTGEEGDGDGAKEVQQPHQADPKEYHSRPEGKPTDYLCAVGSLHLLLLRLLTHLLNYNQNSL